MARLFTYSGIVVIIVFLMAGCINDIIIDDVPDDENIVGEIVMNQTGGFAGFSRTITIKQEGESILLAYTDHNTNLRKESSIPSEDLAQLWQDIEANDVFTLSDDNRMLETVRDGFNIEITVRRGEKYNQFSTYAPDLLVDLGETRYHEIVQAIRDLTDPLLENAEELVVSDMPITDVSIEILESFPMQLHLVVKGYLSDGCTAFNEVTQRRDGNTVHVRITTKRPRDTACIMVITDVTIRVPLEGGFLPGRYKIIVNDVEQDISI